MAIFSRSTAGPVTACALSLDSADDSGYRFALAEMKVVMFMLLQNFKFEILPSKPVITRKNL